MPGQLYAANCMTRAIPYEQIRLPKALYDAAASSGNAALLNTPTDAAGGESSAQKGVHAEGCVNNLMAHAAAAA